MINDVPVTALPVVNLLARPILLALCRRALSPAADIELAPLTARRIEHARVAQTELLKRISSLKADVGILQEKALSAQRNAQQAQLDLRLFAEQYPAPPPRRGLFRPHSSQDEQDTERRRNTLSALADQTARDAQVAQSKAEAAGRELQQCESELAASRKERGGYELALRDEVGACVLELVAAGRDAEARRMLADLRRNIRGELVLGTLSVLVELFSTDVRAAYQALADAAPIFEQHRDPAVRILELLIKLADAGGNPPAMQASTPLTLTEAGAYMREQFSQPALFRLYALVRALGGIGCDASVLQHDPLLATCIAIENYINPKQENTGEISLPAATGSTTEPAPDAFIRLLQANSLVRAGHEADVLRLCGFDPDTWTMPKRKRDALPSLFAGVTAIPVPAWPAIHMASIHTALACHGLLAAKNTVAPSLLKAWLDESYGWPKDDFYWWMLAEVQGDQTLLRNVQHEPGQMFIVAC